MPDPSPAGEHDAIAINKDHTAILADIVLIERSKKPVGVPDPESIQRNVSRIPVLRRMGDREGERYALNSLNTQFFAYSQPPLFVTNHKRKWRPPYDI